MTNVSVAVAGPRRSQIAQKNQSEIETQPVSHADNQYAPYKQQTQGERWVPSPGLDLNRTGHGGLAV